MAKRIRFKKIEEIKRTYLPNKYGEEQKNIDEMTPEELNKYFEQKLKQKLEQTRCLI